MSLVSKKPLIKQQTVYDGEEKAKSKMSFTTKRVSFDSTTIQSDSDEENSLGRSNRKPVKKPNGDDDDLLNMFRSELSDSEDDILQIRSEVKSKGVGKLFAFYSIYNLPVFNEMLRLFNVRVTQHTPVNSFFVPNSVLKTKLCCLCSV